VSADRAPLAPAGAGSRAPLLSPAAALLFVAFAVALWTALPALLQAVPHADNVEQLDWAHSLEWGYLKHPPLPTWLLHAGIALLGPSAALTYGLAMGCVGLTLLLVWALARELLGAHAALLALLLTSADYYLMGRGSFLNHNTVMLPFVAASAWAALRIVRRGEAAGAGVWVILGLAQGLGLLTKYQMAVVIAANAVAILAAGGARQPRFAARAALASAATLLPLVPHLLWLRGHDFSTFSYAGQSLLAGLPLADRVHATASFAVQQLGRLAPAIVAGGLAWGLGRLWRGTPAWAPPPDADVRLALAVLAWTPLVLVLALGLFAGVALQNHWGASTTLLLPLWAVGASAGLRRLRPGAALAATLAVHAAAAGWNMVDARRSHEFHYTFAARPLADAARAYWQARAPGRLAILVGPDWDTGALALELPGHPEVIGSGERRQAPWVDDARLAQCGALVFWRPDQPPEAQVGAQFAASARDVQLLQAPGRNGTTSALKVGILAPQGAGC
jgi:4-amino-4-deoxy-L-arabinose transferase-like glycosyltransferase